MELDAYQRGGLLDLVTPAQVVASKGRLIKPPEGTLDIELSPPRAATVGSADATPPR